MKSASADPGPRPTSRQPSASSFAVVNNEPFLRSQQLVGDDQRADSIVAGAAAGIAYHMRIAFLEAGEFGGIKSRIHAGQNREAPPWRQRELALVAEIFCVSFIGSEHLCENFGHRALLKIIQTRRKARASSVIFRRRSVAETVQ